MKGKLLVWVSLVVFLLAALGGGALGLTYLRPVQAEHAPAGALLPTATPTDALLPTATPADIGAPPITSDVLTALEETLERIYQQVSPSVVYIQVLKRQTATQWSGWSFRLPGWPFEFPTPPAIEEYQRSSGSGFVWDIDGHVVTNYHVVSGADEITVRFPDGTVVEGVVVGANADSDLAVVRVDVPADVLRPVRLGDSDQVDVGDLAVAIGNPFGLENTMTVGFVSALGRSMPVENGQGQVVYSIPEVIQTDAPINPGNSGGVLVNDQGEVIGVTTAIVSPVRASAGVGFAVPVSIVRRVVPALIEDGRYAVPWLGISGTSLDSQMAREMGLDARQRGALVIDVTPRSPADEAGLRGGDRTVVVGGVERRVGGDVIVAIDEQPIETFEDLVAYLFGSAEVGQRVTLTILRDGRQQHVAVTLGERPISKERPGSVTGK